MYALSVHQPWASAIALGFKPVENRDWKPWRSVLGQRIVIHSTQRMMLPGDVEEVAELCKLSEEAVRAWPSGCLVGSAVLGAYIEHPDECIDPVPSKVAPWFRGKYGWLMRGAEALASPPKFKGAQGLWQLPEHARLKHFVRMGLAHGYRGWRREMGHRAP